MQKRTVDQLNMLKRVNRFILENPITPPIALVTELSADIVSGITALESAAGDQVGGSLACSGGEGTRLEQAKALRKYLKDVARVGRSLPRATHPGVAEIFVLPESRGYDALMASATAMTDKATELQTEFAARGLTATFLTEIAALIAAFRSGTDVKIDGHQTQVEATSTLRHSAPAAMDAAIQLDAIVRAHFRDNPVKLDGWASARHVARPANPPGSGGDDGSGSGGDTGGSGGGSGIVAIAASGGEGSLLA